MTTVITIISASHAMENINPVENLIRKRLLDNKNPLAFPPNQDELLESFFGRIIEAEMSYSYSLSLSYSAKGEDTTSSVSSPPATIIGSPKSPSASPTFTSTRVTVAPTPFVDDSSNDNSEAPSSISSSDPSTQQVVSPSPSPSITITNDPTSTPTSSNLSLTFSPSTSPTSSNSSNLTFNTIDQSTPDTTIVSNGETKGSSDVSTSMVVIPAVGVVTGLLIAGIAWRSVDIRSINLLNYRNLDDDSLSNFSLQGA